MAGRDTGIYVIQHLASGRRYVGSAVSFKKRWYEHVNALNAGRHHSSYLMRCWRKYGPDAFTFTVALYCDRENLLMYEQALIDFYRPEFNSNPTAGSMLGFRMTAESKAKLSAAAKRTKNFTGHRHTEESKRRISESRKGKGGGPMALERRQRIGAAHKGRIISPEMRARISAKLTGTSTGRGYLSAEQVREVRRLKGEGFGKCRIAARLGIPENAADSVIRNNAYLWVK
jgi:group I intron endonuclease